ncbi:MAG: protease [Pseudomonadota bacterium]|jgi:protease I
MNLKNMRIAVLAERDFEDLELWYPLLRLREAGAETVVVGMGEASYRGKHGIEVKVDRQIADIGTETFDGIVVPGGWAPDRLRRDPAILALVRRVFEQGRMIASICHGPWVLISARICAGKRMAGVVAVKDDLEYAGAVFVDEEVVIDGNLVTARTPRDIPAWGRAIVAALAAQQALERQVVERAHG